MSEDLKELGQSYFYWNPHQLDALQNLGLLMIYTCSTSAPDIDVKTQCMTKNVIETHVIYWRLRMF
jgi:hypothetical protein